MNRITLHGGPHNGRTIETLSGTPGSVLKMAIYDGGERVGAKAGTAFYEVSEGGGEAFYLNSEWYGAISDIIDAGDQ